MTADTRNALWVAAAEKICAAAPSGALPVVVRRATEQEYERLLSNAASELIALTEEKTNE